MCDNCLDSDELKFDYNFHLIKRDDGPISTRIDYTNLLPYWDEVTNSDPAAKKRSVHERLSQMSGSPSSGMLRRDPPQPVARLRWDLAILT